MKTYIVSGASSGIGKSICEKLLSEGHSVIGLARDHSKFQPNTSSYHPVTVDFSRLNELSKHLKSLCQKFPSVDGIICSAGYGQFGSLEQFSDTQVINLINVNFTSQAMLIKAWLPMLKHQKDGHIVILGSEAALTGEKHGSIYCASKFAVRGFSQSLRKECANAKVAVTVINPGFVNTPFFDNQTFAPLDPTTHAIQPEKIADTVLTVINTSDCVYEEINLQPMTKHLKKQ